MSQIGSSLHGINFATASFSKDIEMGKADRLGKADRTPFAKGSAKFSSISQLGIKLSTLGRPEARAAKMTTKSLETASRSVGEMFGAMAKGDTRTAREWMNQADRNLGPLVEKSNLRQAAESQDKPLFPEQVRVGVMNARMAKHLGSMPLDTLLKVAHEAGQPGVDLGMDTPLVKQAVLREIDKRGDKLLKNLKEGLNADPQNADWMKKEFDVKTQQLAKLAVARAGVTGKPRNGEGLADKLKVMLLQRLPSAEKREEALGNMPVMALTNVLKYAHGPLKAQVEGALVDRFQSFEGEFANKLNAFKAQPTHETALAALVHWEKMNDMAPAVDRIRPDASSGEAVIADLDLLMGTLGSRPESLRGMSTSLLERVISHGEQAGMNFKGAKGAGTISADARGFHLNAGAVTRERAAAAYEALQEKDLRSDITSFKSEMADLYRNLRVASRALPSEVSDSFMAEVFNDMHFDEPARSGVDSVAALLSRVR